MPAVPPSRRCVHSLLLALLLAASTARGASPHKPIPKAELDRWAARLYDGARPKEYRGDHLGYVALPLGGIGTGSVALNGQGRLIQWQIFNLGCCRIPARQCRVACCT